MKPIRVLHMIGTLNIGGSQSMVLNLYRALDRNKVQFDFILDQTDPQDLTERVLALGARVYTMPRFDGKNIIQVKRAWNQFFCDHPEYKILHSHVRSYASIYLPIAKKHGVKTIIHSHSTSNGKGIKALVKATMQYPLRFLADYYFSCSEEAGRWLFGNRIVDGNKHFIIKNAIDAGAYRIDDEVRMAYIQELGLSGKRVYAHVGRFHSAKNHVFLLRVFQRIHQQEKSAVLLLVGDGELRGSIEEQIDILGIRDAVLLLGSRYDIPKLLQAADVFLFPSVWEGLGIVAVEAQAAGLPCICSDRVPNLVETTEHCYFLPLDEDVWVRAALDAPRQRTDTYSQIIAAGFDVRTTAQWMEQFYCNL